MWNFLVALIVEARQKSNAKEWDLQNYFAFVNSKIRGGGDEGVSKVALFSAQHLMENIVPRNHAEEIVPVIIISGNCEEKFGRE